jgi:hypothetical protein
MHALVHDSDLISYAAAAGSCLCPRLGFYAIACMVIHKSQVFGLQSESETSDCIFRLHCEAREVKFMPARARNLINGSKFRGRRPLFSEILEWSSTS